MAKCIYILFVLFSSSLIGQTGILYINSIAVTSDDQFLVAGDWKGNVHIWDIKNRKKVKIIPIHNKAITSIAIAPENVNFIITGSHDKTVKCWDVNTWKIRYINKQKSPVYTVDILPETGDDFLSGCSNGIIYRWESATGKLLEEYKVNNNKAAVFSVKFSFSGDKIIAGYRDGTTKIWDVRTSMVLYEIDNKPHPITCVAFSKDENYLLIGSADGFIRVYETKTYKLIQEKKQHSDRVSSAIFSSESNLIFSGGKDNIAVIWDFKSDTRYSLIKHTGMITSTIFSNNGNLLFTGGHDGTIMIWSRNNLDNIAVLK